MRRLTEDDLTRARTFLTGSNGSEVFADILGHADEIFELAMDAVGGALTLEGQALMFAGFDNALSRLRPDQMKTLAVLALKELATERAIRH